MDPPKPSEQMCSDCAVVYDPRRQHPTPLDSREAIRTIPILEIMCGAQRWVESEPRGQAHHQWLGEVLDLPQGIPSHDKFGRMLA